MQHYSGEGLKVLFTGISGRSSSEVRGIQISSADENFYYCDQNKLTSEIIESCDAVILVRNFVHNIASFARSKGKIVGYDLIDRPVADVHNLSKQGAKNPEVNWDAY